MAAAVIRVKRRRNEDPAEALILSQKKCRLDSAASNDSNIDSVLEFATTLSSKNEPVAQHIKEAIKKKKLHRQLHPHLADPKPKSDLLNKVRAQNVNTSQNNRYSITCKRRALNIDSLDAINSQLEASESHSSATVADSVDDKENRDTADSGIGDTPKATTSNLEDAKPSTANGANGKSEPSGGSGLSESEDNRSQSSGGDSHKVVCLLDVEQRQLAESQASTSGITVNNVPMISQKSVPVEEESDDYVYDLYYAHAGLRESQLGDVLTVEALCHQLVCPEDSLSDGEEVGDLDEDSNDEGNWRNDYPDEDPGFYDNDGQDYDYANDLQQRNFDDSADEGELLSYWMDTRCRIEVDCSDFTRDDKDSDDQSLSDEYKDDD